MTIVGLLDYWRFGVEFKLRSQRVAVVEARKHFGNPEEREYLPLKAVTRRLMKREQPENLKCVLQ
jgi:hypothetical protein